MSPQSLLYTPVDLLQSAPHEGAPSANGEGAERRAALVVLGGVFVAMLLVMGVALQGVRKPPCPAPGAAAPAATCTARA